MVKMKNGVDLSKAKKVKNNIVARGEVSGHSHIVVGDADVLELDGDIYIDVKGEAAIKHLLEAAFTNNKQEVWTKEHKDIPLEKGVYKFVQQVEYDPYNDAISKVND